MCNLHCITLLALVLHFFALVLHILHSLLSQSESSNFAMYIINTFTVTTVQPDENFNLPNLLSRQTNKVIRLTNQRGH